MFAAEIQNFDNFESDFPLQSSIKWHFSLILSISNAIQWWIPVFKFCTSGTLVKNDNFYLFFLYVEVQIEQIKMIQSLR